MEDWVGMLDNGSYEWLSLERDIFAPNILLSHVGELWGKFPHHLLEAHDKTESQLTTSLTWPLMDPILAFSVPHFHWDNLSNKTCALKFSHRPCVRKANLTPSHISSIKQAWHSTCMPGTALHTPAHQVLLHMCHSVSSSHQPVW